MVMPACDGGIELENIRIDARKRDHMMCVHAQSACLDSSESRSSIGYDGDDIKLPEEFILEVSTSSRVKVLVRPLAEEPRATLDYTLHDVLGLEPGGALSDWLRIAAV